MFEHCCPAQCPFKKPVNFCCTLLCALCFNNCCNNTNNNNRKLVVELYGAWGEGGENVHEYLFLLLVLF